MSLAQMRDRVREADRRMTAARLQVEAPVAALLVRERRHPLTAVGAAAGVGLLLGRFVPLPTFGAGRVLGGLAAQAVAQGAALFSLYNEQQ